jgi:DNA-binding NtrC family response regulator
MAYRITPQSLKADSTSFPDVLIASVELPDLGGLDLAISLKKLRPDCQVLLLSTQVGTSEALVTTVASFGSAVKLLPKPLHPTRLLEMIGKT